MTDPSNRDGPGVLGDTDRWDEVVGRTVRGIWHIVGFYAAVAVPVERLTASLIVGATPTLGPTGLPLAVSMSLAVGLAVLLSVVRPAVSSARTLAFGLLAAVGFDLALSAFGQPAVSGRPLVAVDVALSAVGTLSLSAAIAYGFDPADLTGGGVGS